MKKNTYYISHCCGIPGSLRMERVFKSLAIKYIYIYVIIVANINMYQVLCHHAPYFIIVVLLYSWYDGCKYIQRDIFFIIEIIMHHHCDHCQIKIADCYITITIPGIQVYNTCKDI